MEAMIAAAQTIHTRSPQACRAFAERQFTHLVMAEEYVRMYRCLLDTGKLPPGGRPAPLRTARVDRLRRGGHRAPRIAQRPHRRRARRGERPAAAPADRGPREQG